MTGSQKFIFLFIILTSSLGRVMSHLYLPSLPAIAQDLNVDRNLIQLSVAIFLIGFSVSQLIYGPISDYFGRRTPLFIGLLIASLGTILGIMANSLSVFLVARLLQGIGSGAGDAITRAMKMDVYPKDVFVEYVSYFSIGSVLIGVFSPLVGGYIQHHSYWQYNFVALLSYIVVLLLMLLYITETNQFKMASLQPKLLISKIKHILANRQFLGFIYSIVLAYGGVGAWLTSGPFLIQKQLGYGPITYGKFALGLGAGFAVAAFINAKLSKFVPITTLILLGFGIMLLSGVILLISCHYDLTLTFLFLAIQTFVVGTSFVLPNAFAGGLLPFNKSAGLAGSIIGTAQIFGGAVFSLVISLSNNATQLPLSLAFILLSIMGMFIVRIQK
jgi:Bcr/CflA subfamily drug resistance transporter